MFHLVSQIRLLRHRVASPGCMSPKGGAQGVPIQLPAEIPVNLPDLLEKIETYYITQAARRYPSSRKIAKALGISHTTVINKMKRLETR